MSGNWKRKYSSTMGLIAGTMAFAAGTAFADGNIDPLNKFAWSENSGWQNYSPTNGGITVYMTNGYLSGYAWAENIGWVKMGVSNGPYANTDTNNYGVNMDTNGNLSGYAWSENGGWINFSNTYSQVTINTNTGSFDGYAWGKNVGWVHFKNASPAYNVRMVKETQLSVSVTNISRVIWQGENVASNSFQVWQSSGINYMFFTNTIIYTNCGIYTNWLSVTPANDTSHGELKTVWLVFNTTNLPASNQPYQATVRIDATDEIGRQAIGSPQMVQVSVYVNSSPRLWVSQTNLSNSVSVGHYAPVQQIYVANTSAPPRISMAYSVVSQTSWITNSPSSGSVIDETNTVSFIYPTENLTPPGWYTGTVTVTASGIATQNIDVVMRVNNIPGLSWNAGQQTWTNTITEGQTLSGFTFDVWNGSAAPMGTMNFTVSDDADWLSLSPVSGTSTGDHQAVAVTYSVSNLSPGVHTGTVTLAGVDASTGDSASNSPLTIVANLTVRGRATLAISADSLTNSVLENCEATNAPAFYIWNETGTPRNGLRYSITSSDWLSASPSSGIITNETNAITVVWTPGSSAPGTYSGSIVVDGTDELTSARARGAPKTINVQMTVLSRTPVNYENPTIYGTPYIGQTLSARNGLWQNMNRLTFTYQWQRVNNSGGSGVTSLSGETASNYVIVAADKGKYMRIIVTATDAYPAPPLSTIAYSELVSTAKIKATPGDFNSDGITDLWFFDPVTGMWRAAFAANSFAEGQFGSLGMIDVPGDYNGDGILDLGLYDPANAMWYVLFLPSGPSFSGSMFGGLVEETQATPVPDDYDGDGQTDVALYWCGYWAILYSTLNKIVIVPPIADASAVPAPGDYDGDGATDLGVYDSGLWTILNVWGQLWSVQFGNSAWIPAPGDYDGDNITDLCIFNQTSNVWSMTYSTSGTTTNAVFPNPTRSFGSSAGGNLPRQGYYDHDRYCDPATLHYSANGDFVIWCITRTADTNFLYRGQTYQKSINDWRVSW